MNEIVAVDVYNMRTTGGVTMTISGAASDSHHIPTVIIRREHERACCIREYTESRNDNE